MEGCWAGRDGRGDCAYKYFKLNFVFCYQRPFSATPVKSLNSVIEFSKSLH